MINKLVEVVKSSFDSFAISKEYFCTHDVECTNEYTIFVL